LTTWRIVFMGTPQFACPSLEALLGRDDPVVAVVCQPDRPRGRGMSVIPPETKRLAEQHGIPVFQPVRLRDAAFQDALRGLAPDLGVVAAYGRILPPEVLDLPTHGCINVHASLLPRHRGAAPIQWSILSGDATTGITIMRMNEELDTGDVLLQRSLGIRADHTAGRLTADLADLGAHLLCEAIDAMKGARLPAHPQPSVGITLAPRIDREQGRIDWRRDATDLERLVRAMAPTPSAFTTLGGKVLKVHRASVVATPQDSPPGTVLAAGPEDLCIQTGRGALRLLEVQLEGRKTLPVAAFLAGFRIPVGSCLGDT
jgi:methionyl-tRNA formyltransferase